MTLTSKLEGVSRARPVAEEYLRRFPNGTYAYFVSIASNSRFSAALSSSAPQSK